MNLQIEIYKQLKKKYLWVDGLIDVAGIIRVQDNNNKYGLVNGLGIEIIECKYEYIGDFYFGFAKIMDSSCKWGYINEQGIQVIPCIYENTDMFDGQNYVLINIKDLIKKETNNA